MANDSFSQRSFHHSMVTRSPNHMCASSCRMVSARDLVGRVGDLRAEDVLVADGDRAGVLHRARVELRHEELVVLRERVGVVELLLEPVEALPGDREDLLRVEVLGQRGPAVDAQRHRPPVALPGAVHAVVRAGDERRDVGGDPRRRREAPHRALRLGRRRVGDHRPALRRLHGEPERRLQVRLLEAREHPAGVRHLELRVEVSLLVHRVDEAVQPLAGVGVRAVRDDRQLVAAGPQPRERDP